MIKQKLQIIGVYLLIAAFIGLLALLIGPRKNTSSHESAKAHIAFQQVDKMAEQ